MRIVLQIQRAAVCALRFSKNYKLFQNTRMLAIEPPAISVFLQLESGFSIGLLPPIAELLDESGDREGGTPLGALPRHNNKGMLSVPNVITTAVIIHTIKRLG